MKLRIPETRVPTPSKPGVPSKPDPVTPTPGSGRPSRPRKPTVAPVEVPPNEFGSTLEKLLGNKFAKSRVNEEEIYAALVLHQLKEQFGGQYSVDFRATYKLNAFDKPKGETFASAERAANDSLKFFVESTLLTEEQAQAIKDKAFALAQLDNNKTALWDGTGDTKADTSFTNAQRLIQARLDQASEGVNGSSSRRVRGKTAKNPKLSAVG